MVTVPTTKYARSGDVHVAYQVVGDGPLDLVCVPGWVSHIEYAWEEPSYSRFLRRLASFSRLILLDRRGTGLSDRVAHMPTLEQRMDDVRAVMDAAGSKRAALFGISEGGPMCMMFAATYPARTSALILYGTFARILRAPDYAMGVPNEVFTTFIEYVEATWGTGETSARLFAPSRADDEAFRQSWGRFERFSASPASIKAQLEMLRDTDARHVLPAIAAQTLVMHRQGDRVALVQGARYIAERIAGAKYVELPGIDHFLWVGNCDEVPDEVEEFLTGVRPRHEFDRVLATVLFTDIVGATDMAAQLGDRDWTDLLEQHHSVIREQLKRFRGREIDTAGDGFLASFDGPARGVQCACSIVQEVRRLGLQIRAGLHTGECEVMNDKLSGIAVHTGARVASFAGEGEVLVSSTVKDLMAGSKIGFSERGEHVLKGVPGRWRLFAVDFV